MKIETKFSIGDTVYYFEDDKVRSGYVSGIRIVGIVGSSYVTDYNIDNRIWCSENNLSKSEWELIGSLLCNNKVPGVNIYDYSKVKPNPYVSVIGFNKDWINRYNPNGAKIGLFDESRGLFISTELANELDNYSDGCYNVRLLTNDPQYWMPILSFSKTINK